LRDVGVRPAAETERSGKPGPRGGIAGAASRSQRDARRPPRTRCSTGRDATLACRGRSRKDSVTHGGPVDEPARCLGLSVRPAGSAAWSRYAASTEEELNARSAVVAHRWCAIGLVATLLLLVSTAGTAWASAASKL